MHLEWSDVDFGKGVIHIRVKAGWKPKSGESRVVPLTAPVVAVMETLPRSQCWIFARGLTHKHRSPCTASTSARHALKALKVVSKELGLPGRLHTFRHSFISHVLSEGTPESLVRSWVGHIDPAILRIYTHVGDKVSILRLNQLFGKSSEPNSA